MSRVWVKAVVWGMVIGLQALLGHLVAGAMLIALVMVVVLRRMRRKHLGMMALPAHLVHGG